MLIFCFNWGLNSLRNFFKDNHLNNLRLPISISTFSDDWIFEVYFPVFFFLLYKPLPLQKIDFVKSILLIQQFIFGDHSINLFCVLALFLNMLLNVLLRLKLLHRDPILFNNVFCVYGTFGFVQSTLNASSMTVCYETAVSMQEECRGHFFLFTYISPIQVSERLMLWF